MDGVRSHSISKTPLQLWTAALFSLLEDARGALDEETFPSFIAIGCERIGAEAARLAVAEASRATWDAAAGETA